MCKAIPVSSPPAPIFVVLSAPFPLPCSCPTQRPDRGQLSSTNSSGGSKHCVHSPRGSIQALLLTTSIHQEPAATRERGVCGDRDAPCPSPVLFSAVTWAGQSHETAATCGPCSIQCFLSSVITSSKAINQPAMTEKHKRDCNLCLPARCFFWHAEHQTFS